MFVNLFLQPEMEMVARGLEKHLKVEQREYLMKMYVEMCGEETRRSVGEALGLVRYLFLSWLLYQKSRCNGTMHIGNSLVKLLLFNVKLKTSIIRYAATI